MKEMQNLDETDVHILELLVEDGRRPYSDIAERVNLSPPAVSSRVDRLEDLGIVRGFTVDVDGQQLQERQPVSLEFDAQPGDAADLYADVRDLDGVKTVSRTHDGRVIAYANAPTGSLDDWVAGGIDFDRVREYHLRPVDEHERVRDVSAVDFALDCPVCGNDVGDDGVTAEVGDRVYTFCCPSCRKRHEKRYDAVNEGVND